MQPWMLHCLPLNLVPLLTFGQDPQSSAKEETHSSPEGLPVHVSIPFTATESKARAT